tara:strand:+ start:930 stop:1109 length:180 start_codon:yes stop_codon:yes gene_type:complete
MPAEDKSLPLHVLHTRVSPPLLSALDKARYIEGMRRSEMVRSLVREGLRNRGVWPPKSE